MWIIDTCVILDVFENDPQFGFSSARCLTRLLPEGLGVSPLTMVELSVAFSGRMLEQKWFLDQAGISYSEPWTTVDTEAAHTAWNLHVVKRRRSPTKLPKRPLPDILIGGYAANRSGLVTRNPSDFVPWFPRLRIIDPSRDKE